MTDLKDIQASIKAAESLSDLTQTDMIYLRIMSAMVDKGTGPNRHGPSIKCPDIYDALRDEGKSKEQAAKISNECYSNDNCNCH